MRLFSSAQRKPVSEEPPYVQEQVQALSRRRGEDGEAQRGLLGLLLLLLREIGRVSFAQLDPPEDP